MTELVTINYKGKRETEKALLSANAVACGFNPDGTLVIDFIDHDTGKGVRARVSKEDVESQRHVFADWATRRGA